MSFVQWTLHRLQSRLFFLSLCASRILLCSWFYPNPMLDFSRACSILYPLRPLRPIFSVLLAQPIVLRHRSKSFACNVVFMVFGLWRFCSLSRGSTRFHFSTEHRFGILLWCTVRLSCHLINTRFLDALGWLFTRHSWCHGSFQFLFAFLRVSLYSSSCGSIK